MSKFNEYCESVGLDPGSFTEPRFIMGDDTVITGVGTVMKNATYKALFPSTLKNPEHVSKEKHFPNFLINGAQGRLVFQFTKVKDLKLTTPVLTGFTYTNNGNKNSEMGMTPKNVDKMDGIFDITGIFKSPRNASTFVGSTTPFKTWGGSRKSIGNTGDNPHHTHTLAFHFMKWGNTRWYDPIPSQWSFAYVENNNHISTWKGPCGTNPCNYPTTEFDSTAPKFYGPLYGVNDDQNRKQIRAQFNAYYRGPKEIANVASNRKLVEGGTMPAVLSQRLKINYRAETKRGDIAAFCKENLKGVTTFNTETMTYQNFVKAIDEEYESTKDEVTDQMLRYKKLLCGCEYPVAENDTAPRECSNVVCRKHGYALKSDMIEQDQCPDMCIQIQNISEGAAAINVVQKCGDDIPEEDKKAVANTETGNGKPADDNKPDESDSGGGGIIDSINPFGSKANEDVGGSGLSLQTMMFMLGFILLVGFAVFMMNKS